MEHVIQVELRADTTHTLTWLDAALKPTPGPGMVLLHKDDRRAWTVVHAYITPQEMRVNHSDWKLAVMYQAQPSKENGIVKDGPSGMMM